MIHIQTIENVSDCVPLYLPQSLYLKPVAKFNIFVSLPANKTGKSISNLEVMNKLSAALKPDKFLLLRVSKSTVQTLTFEAELESRKTLRLAIDRLDGIHLRVNGFNERFRVRACETKDEFPTRHDWNAFFRDASNMDEMKPGERPDTIHLSHLPIRWFCPRQAENEEEVKPSESIFKRIFEKFGSVRHVDIPICDGYRSKMNADINGMRTFGAEQDVLFEAYVQFDEYVGFVRAMDEFRGMKLVRKFVDKTQAISIKITFDRTKHLSEASIMRRERVRKRLTEKAKAEEEEMERVKREEEERLERERQAEREKEEQQRLAELEKKRQREEVRREKHLKKIQERTEHEYAQKIRVEERKLKIAQRKLESIRILGAVFERIQEKYEETLAEKPSTSAAANPQREEARVRLVEKYIDATEKLVTEQRQKVQGMKNQTPLQGLLQSSNKKKQEEQETKAKTLTESVNTTTSIAGTEAAAVHPVNPFKAMAVAATEWMETMGGMFPYMPGMLPGMAPAFRPPGFMGMRGMMPTGGYRGMPRMRGGYFGRGRGRGAYDPAFSTYRPHHEETEGAVEGMPNEDKYHPYAYGPMRYPRGRRGAYKRGGGKDYYYAKKHGRRHHRSHSRSRSRSRTSYSRSRSRSHRRSRHYSKRSRSRSRSYYSRSRSRSHSHSRSERSNRKLVSTRRSRTVSYSTSSRSRSRSHSRSRSSRHHTHKRGSRRHSRNSSERSTNRTEHRSSVVLETDELVRSAEVIQRTLENDFNARMRGEEREIKQNFHKSKPPTNLPTNLIAKKVKEVDDYVDEPQEKRSRSSSARRSYEKEYRENVEHHERERKNSRQEYRENIEHHERERENSRQEYRENIEHHERERKNSRHSSSQEYD